MSQDPSTSPPAPKWQPLNSRQRRVLGVLVEKAKTVPDSYPMTLNGIVTGCNQKSNRDPQMELSEDDIQQVLEELRAMGAVTEVQTSGRVAKFRHHVYEWLGVDKVEIAVMTELLLRGAQTLGDLRGRASRMEPIADLGTLQRIVKALVDRKLMLELTPAGRGQVVSHNLYKERELVELRARFAGMQTASGAADDDDERPASPPSAAPRSAPSSGYTPGVTSDMFAELRVEVAELRAEVARLRNQLEELQTRWS